MVLTCADDDEAGTPDPDFLAVIDATTGSRDHGKVVNTVTIDSNFGDEPHHMQYVWHKGDRVFAGGLLSDTTYVFGVARLPLVRPAGITLGRDTPCGSAPDAYAVLKDGTALATYMGDPGVTGPCRYSNGEVRTGHRPITSSCRRRCSSCHWACDRNSGTRSAALATRSSRGRASVLTMAAEGQADAIRGTAAPRTTNIVRSVDVPRAGHWLVEENPEFVTAELLRFLSRDRAPGRPTAALPRAGSRA